MARERGIPGRDGGDAPLSSTGSLFLAAAALLPPAIWAIVRYRRRLVVRVRVMRERSASIGTFLIETLGGVRLVAASNAGEREAERDSGRTQRLLRTPR